MNREIEIMWNKDQDEANNQQQQDNHDEEIQERRPLRSSTIRKYPARFDDYILYKNSLIKNDLNEKGNM